MRSLRLTDTECQALISTALRARLRKEGFAMGASSSEEPPSFYFPINLNLAGTVVVVRDADGVWTIAQEEHGMLSERTLAANAMHGVAIDTREEPR